MERNDVVLAGKIWDDYLSLEEKKQIFHEIMKKIPIIDYSLGVGTRWSKFRPQTQSAITRFLQEKGEALYYAHSKTNKAA